MNIQKINIVQEEVRRLSAILQSQGFSKDSINEILYGNYSSFNDLTDLEVAFGRIKKHNNVLEKLSDGYTMDELECQGVSSQKILAFRTMLKSNNLSVDTAKAIYQYSVDSTMISKVQGGIAKEQILTKIMSDLSKSLQYRSVPESEITKLLNFVCGLDYQSPLHSNYDIANEYMEQMGFQQNAHVSVRSSMQSIDRCTHIDETIAALEDGLGSTHLSTSMKLYRAVKSSYLEKGLEEGEDLSSLVGKSISNKGQTSTSPLYDFSFASLDDYDTVFEIYTPKGSRGAYIAELSAYDKIEQEVLLNPNDLYIIGVQIGVTDKNGKKKNVLQALCLSKDRECYKGFLQQQDKSQDINQEYSQSAHSDNLPTKQNRFSKFFSQVRERLARNKNQQSQSESTYSQQAKPKEKKFWELEPEERPIIQNETAEIAQKHREEEEQTRHPPTQEAQYVQGSGE